ncbi:MAG: methyltransferase domain-containing protein [Acutalibacteraceae bacterium]|nr:methyltransferase domain-containing protein [Acutalibacteraceae bacterium]
MKQLPQEFLNRMETLLGEEFDDFLKSYDLPPVKAFRVNTAKISVADFEKLNIFGNEKIPYTENGFYLLYDKVGNHPYHHAGMMYVQEPAAMAPAECLDVEKGWCVLDMCAAPGGKTTQLKNKLGEDGVLLSNEIIPSRCKILTGNIERLGLHNTVTTCMDTEKLAKTFPKTFDLIMVDAPCSGEGMFRKDDTAIAEWSVKNVKMCAERQAQILENAAKLLKDGGYIIYATCTFSLEENEMTVDNFLQNHPEFEILPVKDDVKKVTADGILFDGCKNKNITYARRFYPHISKGEGQFMAVLHNKNPKTETVKHPPKQQKVAPIVFEFLEDSLTEYNKENVKMYNGNPVFLTPDFEVKDGVAFCAGITVGEIRKNYILPHHQFFMGMGKYFKRKIQLSADSEEIQKYLHGEEIVTDLQNGWAVVMVDGCPLGGAKIANGKAKNHYPKGLRK